MPQNVVVGQDAIDVAKFVATYAGRQAPRETGLPVCQQKPDRDAAGAAASDAAPRSGGAAVLDIRLIRRDPDAVRTALARRGADAAAAIDRVLELDERWRALTTELEQLRAEQNAASKALQGRAHPRAARAARRAGGARPRAV